MQPLGYIAGPYTHPDPIINVRRAVEAADELRTMHAAVVVPHLSMLWHLISPKGIEEWYQHDLELLAHCDFLVRLPGDSEGADKEVIFAQDNQIPVFDWSNRVRGVNMTWRWLKDRSSGAVQ